MKKTNLIYINILIAILFILTFDTLKEDTMHLYDIDVKTIDAKDINMGIYKNQVLLIVNVASECGFTPQYEELETLYQTYKAQGFMVLGFPSNQFGEQEPDSNQMIKFFCQKNYDVHFDMFSKIDVNGNNTSPLYKHLKQEQGGFLWVDRIKWNFTKFLVDKEGNIVARYASTTSPLSIKEDIEKLLK